MEGVETNFNPSNTYQPFHYVQKVKVISTQTTSEETNGSPIEDIQQLIKIKTPNKT